MDNRVYGVIGIASRMSNWNADFSGYPKTLSDGRIFSSDKALKHAMCVFWEERGQLVLALRSHMLMTEVDKKTKATVTKIVPRTLPQCFAALFDESHLQSNQYLHDLFETVDVKQFGAAFAVEKNNVLIRGAVQIGQGLNVDERTKIVEQSILSPYGNSNAKDESGEVTQKAMASIGTQICVDEAHYLFPFVINPHAYDEWVKLGVTSGYSDVDFENFKQAALHAVTNFSSCSCVGCENEFALFVKTKDLAYLPDLMSYVTFVAGEPSEIHVDVDELLNVYGHVIEEIEVFYDPKKLILTGCDKATVLNIRMQV